MDAESQGTKFPNAAQNAAGATLAKATPTPMTDAARKRL